MLLWKPFAALLAVTIAAPAAAITPTQAIGNARAARVTITRDDWGIAHVRGERDADAVFGAIYAQAEDDFPRVEANLLTALGAPPRPRAKARSGRICDSVSGSTRRRCWPITGAARPG